MTVNSIASLSQTLWRILEARDIDPAPVFEAAGLDPTQWDVPDARFPEKSLDRAWLRAIEVTGDECLGLDAARFSNPVSLHALGFAWLASDSLYDALSRLVRFSDLLSNGLNLELSVSADDCRLVGEHVAWAAGSYPYRVDAFYSGLLGLCRTSVSDTLAPKVLTLRRRRPACAAAYYALFRAPVEFSADTDSMTFDRAVAERPLPTSNRLLARQSDRVIDDYLDRFNANTLADRVRTRLIEVMSSGEFGEADVAAMLNLSQRTLQRRLADEGTSFKVLLDEARRELALRFIGEQRLTIKETSYLLGFSEPGNFSRAFKRWTGTTPSGYRVTEAG